MSPEQLGQRIGGKVEKTDISIGQLLLFQHLKGHKECTRPLLKYLEIEQDLTTQEVKTRSDQYPWKNSKLSGKIEAVIQKIKESHANQHRISVSPHIFANIIIFSRKHPERITGKNITLAESKTDGSTRRYTSNLITDQLKRHKHINPDGSIDVDTVIDGQSISLSVDINIGVKEDHISIKT